MASPISSIVAAIAGICGVGAVVIGPEFIPASPIVVQCENFAIDARTANNMAMLNCSSQDGMVQIQIPNIGESTPTATIDFQTGEAADGTEAE